MGLKRQKLLKHTENILERVFMTKQQNKLFWQKELFFDQNCLKTLEIIENLLRNDKTAKQHKNWKLVKTVKTDKKNWKLLESNSHYQQPIKKFWTKHFTKYVLKRYKSLKTSLKTAKTAKQHKK